MTAREEDAWTYPQAGQVQPALATVVPVRLAWRGSSRFALVSAGGAWSQVAAVLMVAVASCTGAGNADPTAGPAPTDAVAVDSPTPTPDRAALGNEAAATWEAIHGERLEQVYSNEPVDAEAFGDLVSQDAAETLADLIEAARVEVAVELVDTEFWPEVDLAAAGDEAHISDCILVATRPAAQPDAEPTVTSRAWTGVAMAEGDGWRLEAVRVGGTDCVPPGLNRELLNAYGLWHEAKNEWWDPPDPDHPTVSP